MLAPVSTLVELAEDAAAHTPLWPGVDRVVDERFCVFFAENPTFVQRLRLTAGSVAETLEDVRRLARARGRSRTQWWVGSTAEPAGLAAELRELGLADGGVIAAAALDREPAGQPVVPVREVESLADYLAALTIEQEVSAVPAEVRARGLANARERWETVRRSPMRHYLAEVDGEPVAMARAAFGDDAVFLMGGATLPSARGRGAYGSLVVARWQAGGGRPLTVQSSSESLPILERLGFRRVGEIRILLDEPPVGSGV
jgi:hypothetical protein